MSAEAVPPPPSESKTPTPEQSLVDAMANLNVGEPVSKDRYRSIAALAAAGATWSSAEFPFPRPTDPRIVFFDLETTGVSGTSRIVQFGAVTVDPATLVEISRVSLFVRAYGVTPEITRITHITPERIASEPEFAGRAEQIFSVLDGAVWAGYNIIKFDIPRIEYEFGLLGRPAPRCAGILDVYAVAAAWGLAEVTGNLKLDTLSQYYGYGIELHDAADDALKTFQVLRSMVSARAIRKMIDPRSCAPAMNTNNTDKILPAISATIPAAATHISLREAALASRRAFHRSMLVDFARDSEQRHVKDDPTTWPKVRFCKPGIFSKKCLGCVRRRRRDKGPVRRRARHEPRPGGAGENSRRRGPLGLGRGRVRRLQKGRRIRSDVSLGPAGHREHRGARPRRVRRSGAAHGDGGSFGSQALGRGHNQDVRVQAIPLGVPRAGNKLEKIKLSTHSTDSPFAKTSSSII